ncbi:MAG: hypothetical protein K2N34_06915, partial [Lachnospiraceae bacterium]|nr:hypothetical protein [Lachnospiraceae bacterium]
MIRFCNKDIDNLDVNQNHLILDGAIWQKGREYFAHHHSAELVPVLNQNLQLICFAYQDWEANRELRMLRELNEGIDFIGFQDLYPNYSGVTIHGCNELAWYMANYLIKEGISVHLDGRLWTDLGIEYSDEMWGDHNYEIWAEGVFQKNSNETQEWLRSASAEFECVNEIYEANIKAGKITDADGDVSALLDRLRKEKQIVIRGVGTKAQDAYDWLVSNKIDICAFQSGKEINRKSLFGKPILKKEEVAKQLKEAVIIECSEKYSAWGFGDVDQYDYEGYERNKRYLLLRDYIEVSGNNLVHLLANKNLILVGDVCLCSRVYKWFKQFDVETNEIKYWDILKEHKEEISKFLICETYGAESEQNQKDVFLLVGVKYSHKVHISEETAGKYEKYLNRLKDSRIDDYTDYFSDV